MVVLGSFIVTAPLLVLAFINRPTLWCDDRCCISYISSWGLRLGKWSHSWRTACPSNKWICSMDILTCCGKILFPSTFQLLLTKRPYNTRPGLTLYFALHFSFTDIQLQNHSSPAGRPLDIHEKHLTSNRRPVRLTRLCLSGRELISNRRSRPRNDWGAQ